MSTTPNLGLAVHAATVFDGNALPKLVAEINANNVLVDTSAGSVASSASVSAITGAAGANVSKITTAVSSTIKTATPKLLLTATGKVRVRALVFNTDGTGLAGGTNLAVKHNTTNVAVETVANLGASKEIDGLAASVTAFAPFIMDSTDTINVQSTAADCTGAGVLTVTVLAEALTVGAALA